MTEVEVRSGALQIQKSTGLGKKNQKKYAALYHRSHHGVARLEVYDNKEAFEKRAKKQVISLDNCIKIERTKAPESKKHEIHLMLNDNKEQVFLTDSEEDKELWYGALSNVIFGGVVLTENDIYVPFAEEGYDVVLRENEVVQKLNLKGMYRLVITDKNVEIRDKTTKKVAAHWPLMLLRKYGRDKQEFSLEAGRRCQTGPGMFFFVTDHYNEIFQEVDAKVRNLAQAQRSRAQSTSSIKSRKSPTFTHPPESPVPHSPLPVAPEGEYADPRDQLLSPRKPHVEEPVYNEPVNTKPKVKAPKKDKKSSSQVPGPPKPERAIGKKVTTAGEKKKKSKPPPIIEEATYSEPSLVTGKLDANDGAYGSLNFDGKPTPDVSVSDESHYHSLNIGWNGNTAAESEYSTTSTLTTNKPIAQDSEGVYDHVLH